MPFWSSLNFEWTKPLKKSEKKALEKVLLKEGYDLNTIRHMDMYQRKKLWKMYKEKSIADKRNSSMSKKSIKDIFCFWRKK